MRPGAALVHQRSMPELAATPVPLAWVTRAAWLLRLAAGGSPVGGLLAAGGLLTRWPLPARFRHSRSRLTHTALLTCLHTIHASTITSYEHHVIPASTLSATGAVRLWRRRRVWRSGTRWLRPAAQLWRQPGILQQRGPIWGRFSSAGRPQQQRSGGEARQSARPAAACGEMVPDALTA